jgi:hypothetical protein
MRFTCYSFALLYIMLVLGTDQRKKKKKKKKKNYNVSVFVQHLSVSLLAWRLSSFTQSPKKIAARDDTLLLCISKFYGWASLLFSIKYDKKCVNMTHL